MDGTGAQWLYEVAFDVAVPFAQRRFGVSDLVLAGSSKRKEIDSDGDSIAVEERPVKQQKRAADADVVPSPRPQRLGK